MSEQTHERPKKEEQNLIVALRIRPMNEDEIIQGATPIAHVVDKNMVVLMDPMEDPDDILRVNRSREKQYVFDRAFDGVTTQAEIYEHTTRFLIKNVVSGFNATVFAYGATGAGKTHTMLGRDGDPGIMARALNDLFLEMERTKEDMAYKVTMSYLEIYNEMIRDLLNPGVGVLDLREDAKGVQVAGLSEVFARSTEEVMEMLMKGNKERTQEPTAANKTSSRSHAVLQVSVKQRSRVRNIAQEVRVGKLYLIDLAGSERAANTHNRGKRMVEGAHINRSLLALGNCINALSDKNGSKYVNYRDSKLTRLLKDSLGGNCKTVMIAHVSPASIHFEESRNTLVYADRAKQIKTKVRRNVMDVSYHIAQYSNIIAELKEEIGRLRHKLDKSEGDKNSSAIQAIQSEVLYGQRKKDRSGLQKLKEQLLNIFKDQMELRRSLMELNNTSMEISLETSRNQLLVQKWEREKALGIRRRDGDDEERAKEDKQLELEGGDELPEPDYVVAAREELKSLQEEQERTERLKTSVTKEFENARDKASKIEEFLPQKVTNAEQQEILSLLCKVHELEIDNMEMQSSCLLRNFEIRRRDMVIAKYEQHRSLCDEIILQQRALIDEHKLVYPKELDELYELYQQEVRERPPSGQLSLPALPAGKTSLMSMNRQLLDTDSLSDLDRLSTVDEGVGLPRRPVLVGSLSNSKRNLHQRSSQNLSKQEESDKIFSHSPKSKEIRDAMGQNGKSSTLNTSNRPEPVRQQSIITLSSHGAGSPSPPLDNQVSKKNKPHREVIASNTRSIAALAAKRRTKAQLDAYNSDKLPTDPNGYNMHTTKLSNDNKRESENYLSASRLAHHNKKYGGSNMMLRQLLGEDLASVGSADQASLATDPLGRPQIGKKGRHIQANKKAAAFKKRARSHDYANYQQLAKTTPRKTLENASLVSLGADQKTRRNKIPAVPAVVHNKVSLSRLPVTKDTEIPQEFDTAPITPVTVQQSGAEKSQGLVKKKLKGSLAVVSDSSTSSTPQSVGGTNKSKRPPPTIANYRQGSIAVTGTGFQR